MKVFRLKALDGEVEISVKYVAAMKNILQLNLQKQKECREGT